MLLIVYMLNMVLKNNGIDQLKEVAVSSMNDEMYRKNFRKERLGFYKE